MLRRALLAATLAAFASLLVAAAAGAVLVPTGYNPKGLPTAGCFWTGPFVSSDPKTNTAYPSEDVLYMGANFRIPAGGHLTLTGRYVHGRYESFNAYRNDGQATTSLTDVDIRPDKGSVNPFITGHRRDLPDARRRFSVQVAGSEAPASPAGNTLYAPTGGAGTYSDILYRVYLPDRGRDRLGGEPLPTPKLTLADGTVLTGQAMCDALNSNHDYKSGAISQALFDTLVHSPGQDPKTNPALPKPVFEAFFNIPYLLAQYRGPAAVAAADPSKTGGLYNNHDVSYVTAQVSLLYGRVIVLHAKAPTTARTYPAARRMPSGQLRYFDFCHYESLVTTSTYHCLNDQEIPLNRRHEYTIVYAKAADRPRNATTKCGVAWLPFDPKGDGAGRVDSGGVSMRALLPAKGFRQSPARIAKPGTAKQVMGAYLPDATYTSKKAFEKRGCRGAAL